jgi:hypothetical protein
VQLDINNPASVKTADRFFDAILIDFPGFPGSEINDDFIQASP